MAKIIIGLVGEIGSGKGFFIDVAKRLYSDKQIQSIKFSSVLSDVLEVLSMEKSRNNLQKMAIAIDEMFGDGTFNNAVKQRVIYTDSKIIIVDGMRWPADEKMIRDLNGKIIYITADQKTRYKRTLNRDEKKGESEATFKEFQKQELMKNETFIKDIGSRADYKIINETTIEDFENKIKEVIRQIEDRS